MGTELERRRSHAPAFVGGVAVGLVAGWIIVPVVLAGVALVLKLVVPVLVILAIYAIWRVLK